MLPKTQRDQRTTFTKSVLPLPVNKTQSSKQNPPCLTRLRVLLAFLSYALSRLTCLSHGPFSSALHPLFVRPKICLGLICSPAKLPTFQGLLKTPQTVWVKKQP